MWMTKELQLTRLRPSTRRSLYYTAIESLKAAENQSPPTPGLSPPNLALVHLDLGDLNDTMTDIYVKSFTHLKDRRRADNALRLLQKVASLVKPIMRKRGWVLPVLSEFFPDNPNLLGEFLCDLFNLDYKGANVSDELKRSSVL